MKKWLSVLLALTLLMGLASFAAAEEVVTLNWFTKGDKPADYELVFGKLNEYLAEKIGVQVNLNFLAWGEEWDTFVSTQVATNEGDVDIMFTATWDRLTQHIAAGYLIPLNGDPDYGNLLEEHGQAIIDSIDPSYISGNLINGVLYGISCNKELAANHGLLFNPDLVEKYGFDVSSVKTLRDIEPMLQVIKENEPDLIAPFGMRHDQGLAFFQPFVEVAGDDNIAGVYDDNRDTAVLNMYASAEWADLFQISYDWFQAGYISPDIQQRGPSYEADFQSGLYFCIPQSMKPFKGSEFSVNGKASLEVVLTNTVIRTKDVGGSMLAIVEGSQNPEKAMEFLALLESDPYVINTVLFGLEGTHFTFLDQAAGQIEITQDGTDKYPMKGNAWMMGNQFINYTVPGAGEPVDKWDQFIAFNGSGVPANSLGFNFEITPEISPILTNVRNVKTEYLPLFQGQMDPAAAIPEFLAAMEAAGVNELLAAVQAQFDAWLAAQ